MLEHGGRLREAAQQYGIAVQQWLDLSTGLAPYHWPLPAIASERWQRLPEAGDGLEQAACDYYQAPAVLPVAGSQAAIQVLPVLCKGTRVGLLEPCYAEHRLAWERAGWHVLTLNEEQVAGQLDSLDVLVVVNPNNPTGRLLPAETLLAWHRQLSQRGGYLVVDEAFVDLVPEHSLARCSNRAGLIVLRSLGKFFGLAGVRLGFVLAEPAMLQRLAEQLGPWAVSGPARAAGLAALLDGERQFLWRRRLEQDGQRLATLLRDHGLAPAGGCALFQWVPHPQAAELHRAFARRGILLRLFAQPSALRIGLPADEGDWQRLEQVLSEVVNAGSQGVAARPQPNARVRAHTLMVQGTTSDAGKSTLVTALCRWLVRQGVAVAPFKPQNMALNAAVTVDGGEIGRAQAVQAEAANLPPHTDMNPVLLKPNTDTGAQVIIHGHPVGCMDARTYHAYKPVALRAVLDSHARLSAEHRVILVEGAGSPAEINLRAGDIANMGFAEAVDCPVILIADIDKGGVFAHLVGTLELLSASEQARVKGFVINRFRGDIALLKPGLDWLEQRTGKPVLGVLPYLHDLHLEAEDAVNASQPIKSGRSLRVVVPVLPRISNHTDFDPLRLHPQVDLRFVGPGQPVPEADLIILPGSKSVHADLAFLREHGWERAIIQHLRYGGKLLGICGGLQMLGMRVEDPLGLEGPAGDSTALGLLDFVTRLQADKRLTQVKGTLLLDEAEASQAPVSGYEIHAGISHGPALNRPLIRLESGEHDGVLSHDRQIAGTYLHGLFESPQASQALLGWAGLEQAEGLDYAALRGRDIERLADLVEAHLNTELLLELCGVTQ